MTPGPGIEPGTHWWKASALTTTPTLLPKLVLSIGLIMGIGHRKGIRKPTFRALALRRSESRNCGLCVVHIQKDGASLLGTFRLDYEYAIEYEYDFQISNQ